MPRLIDAIQNRLERYTIFAGTNTASEARLAAGALLGLVPLTEGPAIREYEGCFASAAGTRHAISFAAGRMALYALLEALDIGCGDEVILPAFTCVVVPNAILYRGAKPIFTDIDRRTFNMDIRQVEAKITPRTKAIIAQHTFGLLCDIEAVNEIAHRHALPVLEDCAHALGARLRDRPAGSLATAAYFSTDHTKVINTGIGGMVTTDDAALANRVVGIQHRSPFLPSTKLRASLAAFVSECLLLHPRIARVGKRLLRVLWRGGLRHGFLLDEMSLTKPASYPFPARLANAHALLGLSQLADLSANLAWRRHIALLYEAEVGALAGILHADCANHTLLRYTFLVENRKAWEEHFAGSLDMGIWFRSIAAGRETDLEAIGYRAGSCPVAETAARHCVNLPTHARIDRPQRLLDLLRVPCSNVDERFRLLRDQGRAILAEAGSYVP